MCAAQSFQLNPFIIIIIIWKYCKYQNFGSFLFLNIKKSVKLIL